jgi:hypothetical protein
MMSETPITERQQYWLDHIQAAEVLLCAQYWPLLRAQSEGRLLLRLAARTANAPMIHQTGDGEKQSLIYSCFGPLRIVNEEILNADS